MQINCIFQTAGDDKTTSEFVFDKIWHFELHMTDNIVSTSSIVF